MTDDTKRRIDAVLDAASFESQSLRAKAKLFELPTDVAGWLDEYHAYALALPDDNQLPQKAVMLTHIDLSRQHLAAGDLDEVRFYMLQIQENHANAEHDIRVLKHERGSSEGRDKGNRVKQSERQQRIAEVNRLWDQLELPDRDRAAFIAKRMGIDASTVRKYRSGK